MLRGVDHNPAQTVDGSAAYLSDRFRNGATAQVRLFLQHANGIA
jgi:hypothetical protein